MERMGMRVTVIITINITIITITTSAMNLAMIRAANLRLLAIGVSNI